MKTLCGAFAFLLTFNSLYGMFSPNMGCANTLALTAKMQTLIEKAPYSNWQQTKHDMAILIEDGFFVDTPAHETEGYTPLSIALLKNDLSFAHYLLQKGADPDYEHRGTIFSHHIFMAKSIGALKLLQEHSAN